MIRFEQMGVTYAGAERPALANVDLEVPEGELCLVVGRTGSGKSTLLRTVNGLVPHFTGGTLHGRVTVAGRDTRLHPPRELADVVGVVGQDPRSGFVTDVVEEELAYGMESLGLPADVMRRRVEETLDLLGLVELRDRPLEQLSGGQRQRVAIGSVLTVHPRVLVLDEPTSALDPPAAEEVLAALQRLVHDLGVTVLLAEHRLERVVQYADRVIHVPGDGSALQVGEPADVLRTTPVAPPVVELGRVAGWDPLPLSVRDARRRAPELRERLAARTRPPRRQPPATAPIVAAVRDLSVRLGAVLALREVDLAVAAGEVVAVMGRNGAGKSTLLRSLVGLHRPLQGSVRVADEDPVALRPRQLLGHVGLVPQEPADLLYAETVGQECAQADQDAGRPAGTCRALLERLVPGLDDDRHPRDLSEGQRLGLVLALVLVAEPPLLLLDEPTRGLDYRAKERLAAILRGLAEDGIAIVLATHDVELVADLATRTVVIADGEVVADGPTDEVVVGSPAFSPQVAKVLAPAVWLTPAEVAGALAVDA
ncbi:ABC transporter ATP-binding protein [Egicoccus halophilus]|uniref:Cobalt ABC transporter ATP-binding protein n=1 Tax=Egicoccus halophilus TaxID=1670830 RepID=A0A8J3EV81_9ACTN|nr:ABC transporter ATP-binding protein [Egicoccus halophilus]GGI09137.1 cobalt ABC transporter ATP-binding protein [Egicoccus halophilus]